MNDYSRNVVIVGFDKKEIGLSDIRDMKDKWDSYSYKDNHRFPYLVFVDSFAAALKHQGFMLIIDDRDIGVDNYYLFDMNNRKKFKKYNLVLILSDNINLNSVSSNSISKIKFVRRNSINDLFINMLYKEFNSRSSFTKNKVSKLEKMKDYLNDKKYIKSREIADYFHISLRSVERDMKDMNILYDNVGYDNDKRCWYVVD